MSTLLSQGGFGCIYYPGIECSGKSSLDKKYVSKLQKKDFNAKNEIIVGTLIKKISNYNKHFLPVIDSCKIDIKKIDANIFSDCQVIKRSTDLNYLLMNLEYIENKSLENVIVTSASKEIKKRTFSQLLGMYKYLLQGLNKLIENNIIQFDLKSENLLFSINTGSPLIIDFGISIPKNNLTKDNFKNYFYTYGPEYYVWPLEVHVINYLLHITLESLTNEDIVLIASSYATAKTLTFFSEYFREQFKLGCIYQLKKYVGKPRQKVINTLVSYYKTWDNYALSMMYIGIFQKIFQVGFHYNGFLILFSQLLLINASPNPEVRLTIKETFDEFEKILFVEGNVQHYLDLLKDLK